MTVEDLIKNLKFTETVEIKDADGQFLTLFNTDNTNKVKDYLDKEIYKWYPCFFETAFNDVATIVIMIYN